MNILFLSPYAPVLHLHGGGVRMYHNIRILSECHSVRVISFVQNDDEREMLRSLHPMCESVTAIDPDPDFRPHWFSLKPFLMREFSGRAMEAAVDKAFLEWKVDVIQCEYLQMAHYRRPGPFSILTAHEAVSANAYQAFQETTEPVESAKLFYRWMGLLHYEVSVCRRFDRVITMTEEDAAYLRSYTHTKNIRPIPIGIDTRYFEPRATDAAKPVSVLFIGNFRHTPNVEAAEFLLTDVAPRFPEVRFVIAGSFVPDSLKPGRNVEFPGYIADTRTMFHSPNTIFAAPLFSGTGQRVKLLEAFAMGCPVITTSVGALGFPISNGEQAFIANTAEEFRAALARLLSSSGVRARMGMLGRKMVVERLDWSRIASLFTQLIEHRE